MIGLAPKTDKVNLSVATNTAGAPIALDSTAARLSVNIVELYFKREKVESWDPKLPLIEWAVPFFIKEGLPLKYICLMDFCKRFTVGAGKKKNI